MRYLHNHKYNEIFVYNSKLYGPGIPVPGGIQKVSPGSNISAVRALGDESDRQLVTGSAAAISAAPVSQGNAVNGAVGSASVRSRAEGSVPQVTSVAVGCTGRLYY